MNKGMEAIKEAMRAGAVVTVTSYTNGSYHRNYKLDWHDDVAEGTKLYAIDPAAILEHIEAQDARIVALEKDAALWRKWAPYLSKISRKPFNLTRDLDEWAAAIAKEPQS